ncbi:MAG: glycine betaine ABC transporter substrate-binding protein [Geminicoccaceae bacterium]
MTIYLRSALLGATALLAFSTGARADCGEVTIEMNWASASVVTAVSKFLMEEGYGCAVTVVPSDTVPAVTSVAETGKPDIVTELWINSDSGICPRWRRRARSRPWRPSWRMVGSRVGSCRPI